MATLTLPDGPPQLLADLHAWAELRHLTDEAAAVELIKIGVDATSERGQMALSDLARIFGIRPS